MYNNEGMHLASQEVSLPFLNASELKGEKKKKRSSSLHCSLNVLCFHEQFVHSTERERYVNVRQLRHSLGQKMQWY